MAPNHPDWFHNLVANTRVTVEDGVFTYDAQAVVLGAAERDRAFARAVEADPGWAGPFNDLQEVITTDGADPLLVLPEVERLTEELESHLTYEEEQLIPILDAPTP